MATKLKEGLDYHYSLSNGFFKSFLDGPTLSYTCCCFLRRDERLEEAARHKLELSARKLDLARGDRVLDLGCGWGSFALYAAEERGCRVTAVNLAGEQVRYLREEVARRGLSGRIEVLETDGARLEVSRPWDKVAVIGMSEHVEDKPAFFRRLAQYTRPGGLLLFHSIMTPRPVEELSDGGSWEFLKKHIFPVGFLKPLGFHVAGLEEESFEILDVESLTDHYALTCEKWLRNLEAQEEKLVADGVVDRATIRYYKLYLAGSSKSFAGNHNHIYQILARPFVPYSARAKRPLTRREMAVGP
jgi:cyclopropane-fatty-acyl-phospholipid synthase